MDKQENIFRIFGLYNSFVNIPYFGDLIEKYKNSLQYKEIFKLEQEFLQEKWHYLRQFYEARDIAKYIAVINKGFLKKCELEKRRLYYNENAENLRTKSKEYYEKNKDKILQRKRDQRQKNP